MSVREPGVQVEFYLQSVLQGYESQQAGREIYKDIPFVRIRVAGDNKSEFATKATQHYQARFPEEWAAFSKGIEEVKSGTPIEHWGRVTPSLAKALHMVNVRTVEDIAALQDAAVMELPQGFKLRDDARKFLSMSQTSADLARMEDLEKANEEKDRALIAQGKQLAALEAQVAALVAAKEPEAAAEKPGDLPAPPKRRREKEAA